MTQGDTDGIFHQAAIPSVPRSIRDPVATNDANVNGTLQVLMAAKECGVRKVVYASSSSVYGDTPTLPKLFTSDIKELIQDHLETPPGEELLSR